MQLKIIPTILVTLFTLSAIIVMAEPMTKDDSLPYRPTEGEILWPDKQPVEPLQSGEEIYADERVSNVRVAKIYPYPVKAQTAPAVIIFPGGGYVKLSIVKEGEEIARWLNGLGLHAFIVKNRLQEFGAPAPLLDAQQAIRWVRKNAQQYGVDPNRVGVMGFSAGGHLAASLSQKFDYIDPAVKHILTPADLAINLRPDFSILIYPVITLREPYTHGGSRAALLGDKISDKMLDFYSFDGPLRNDSPPAILVHGSEDSSVPAENSVMYWRGLRTVRVNSELLIYQKGEHGFGMRDAKNPIGLWPERVEQWLQSIGVLLTPQI